MNTPLLFSAVFLGVAAFGLLLRFFLSRRGRLLAATSIVPAVFLFVSAAFLAAAAIVDRIMGSGDFTVINAVSAVVVFAMAILLLRKRARADSGIQD